MALSSVPSYKDVIVVYYDICGQLMVNIAFQYCPSLNDSTHMLMFIACFQYLYIYIYNAVAILE